MTLDEKINLFFEDPGTNPADNFQPGANPVGNLHLLRRDINTAYAAEAKWLGVMGIMAGIDLLAKLYAGTDTNGVGTRFRNFVNQYITGNNNQQTEVIYQLRNSLLHSFGLYSKRNATAAERNAAAGGFDRQDYLFTLQGNEAAPGNIVTLNQTHPIETIAPGTADEIRLLITEYTVDIYALRNAFNAAVTVYRADLVPGTGNPVLRQNFDVTQATDKWAFFQMFGVTVILAVPAQAT